MPDSDRTLFDFSQLLEKLYQPVEPGDFPDHLIATVAERYPEAVLTYHEVDFAAGSIRDWSNCQGVDREECTRIQVQYMHEHPVISYVMSGGTNPLIATTDFVTQREFRRTNFYNLVMRPFRLEHQLVARVPGDGAKALFVMSRDREFGDDDRLLGLLLLPHIAQARERAEVLYRSQAGLMALKETPFEPLRRSGLTRRECEVLWWLIEGKRDREIAIILGISLRTVNNHVANILAKLGVETRTGAASRAMEILGKSAAPGSRMEF